MKILYATYRYDPTNPDLGSSVDYGCYKALIDAGNSVEIIGPVTHGVSIFEKFETYFWRIYKHLTGKSGLKYLMTTSLKASNAVAKAMKNGDFDAVFSIFHAFFVFRRLSEMSFWFFDTTFHGQEEDWPMYGKLALKLTYWQERKALQHIDACATNSEWSKKQLVDFYGLKGKQVTVFPMPSALPVEAVRTLDQEVLTKQLTHPIRILLVGRVFKRKGVDIALEVVRLLNAQGIPTLLKICGLPESERQAWDNVEFVGPFKKSDPDQLDAYIDLYQWAHLLIHPARFEAAGIVPAEAAAFGTPTITNNTGGLGTSVLDGVSGIVLPKGSPPEAYVQAIIDLVNDPERYQRLCQTTRERYEKELNWDVAGKRLVTILEEAVREHKNKHIKG